MDVIVLIKTSLSGFVAKMHSATYKLYAQSFALCARCFEYLFPRALMHSDNKSLQTVHFFQSANDWSWQRKICNPIKQKHMPGNNHNNKGHWMWYSVQSKSPNPLRDRQGGNTESGRSRCQSEPVMSHSTYNINKITFGYFRKVISIINSPLALGYIITVSEFFSLSPAAVKVNLD